MKQFFDISELIPSAFDAYRDVIAESFQYFFRRISPARRTLLFLDQQTLLVDCTPERRLVTCLQSCPTLHKLGQVLARDKRLDLHLRSELQTLESLAPRTTLEEIQSIICEGLGYDVTQFNIELGKHALAEGSVAVVWPATWQMSDEANVRHAVLKILRPNVSEYIDEEIQILGKIADLVDANGSRYGLNGLACRETFEDVAVLVRSEVNFHRERDNLANAFRQFASVNSVAIPELAPFGSDCVTGMTRFDGVKITDASGLTNIDRARLAECLLNILLARAIFSPDDDAIFHGDPHAGNILLMTNGSIGIIDWSLTAQLTRSDRRAITQLFMAGLSLDVGLFEKALQALAVNDIPRDISHRIATSAMANVNIYEVPGINWLLKSLDCAALDGVIFAPNTLVLRKAIHTLLGVVTDISPEFDVDRWFVSKAMTAFTADLPLRSMSLPGFSGFSVPLSNLDLMQTCWSLWNKPLRAWQQAMDLVSSQKNPNQQCK